MIPRTIHQLWLGSKPMPRYARSWEAYCKRYHWTYHLWRDRDLAMMPDLIRWPDIFKKASNYQFKSDLFRIDVLRRFGGFYIDCDIESSGEDMADYIPLDHVDLVAVPDYRHCFMHQVDPFYKYVIDPIVCPPAVSLLTGFLGASTKSKTIEKVSNDIPVTVEMNEGRVDFYTIACPLVSISIAEPVFLLSNYLVLSGFYGRLPTFPHIARRTWLRDGTEKPWHGA